MIENANLIQTKHVLFLEITYLAANFCSLRKILTYKKIIKLYLRKNEKESVKIVIK